MSKIFLGFFFFLKFACKKGPVEDRGPLNLLFQCSQQYDNFTQSNFCFAKLCCNETNEKMYQNVWKRRGVLGCSLFLFMCF